MLVPYRAHEAGFSLNVIGTLGSAYYIGFVLGCVQIPAVIARVGHIRTFTGMAALATMDILVNGLVISEPVWFALRILIGYCFAGLYLSIESWLNSDSDDRFRGRVLAAYVIATWVGVISGKLLFGPLNSGDFAPFAVTAAVVSISTFLVAFTPTPQPALPPRARFRLGRIYRRAPIGLAGCVLVGAANGAFWSLSPIFVAATGQTATGIGLFIAAVVLGGAATQWPLGWISDRLDRRIVILLSAVSATGFAVLLAMFRPVGETGLLVLAFGFGASALPLYSLSVAHANDRVASDEFVEVGGVLLTAFGIGAAASPSIAAFIMAHSTPSSLFYYTGFVHFSLALYVLYRMSQSPPVPDEEKAEFVAVPKSTQAALPLDPRVP